MILNKTKIPYPIKVNNRYLGFFGWRKYKDLFSYYFIPLLTKRMFEKGYLVFTNEKNENVHVTGTIDFHSRNSDKLEYQSNVIDLIIDSCTEIEYELSFINENIRMLNMQNIFNDFNIIFNLKESAV